MGTVSNRGRLCILLLAAIGVAIEGGEEEYMTEYVEAVRYLYSHGKVTPHVEAVDAMYE